MIIRVGRLPMRIVTVQRTIMVLKNRTNNKQLDLNVNSL